MHLFLDCEFNGHGGQLISFALVPEYESIKPLYVALDITEHLDPWVVENVMNVIQHGNPTQANREQAQILLSVYLRHISNTHGIPTIIVDWPDDIKYLCELMITGPGEMIGMGDISFRLRRDLDSNGSKVLHNALEDAKAIRKMYFDPPF